MRRNGHFIAVRGVGMYYIIVYCYLYEIPMPFESELKIVIHKRKTNLVFFHDIPYSQIVKKKGVHKSSHYV